MRPAARGNSIAAAPDEVLAGTINFSHPIVVADEHGHAVATVSYRDAVAVRE